jgi:hypothetical protein
MIRLQNVFTPVPAARATDRHTPTSAHMYARQADATGVAAVLDDGM